MSFYFMAAITICSDFGAPQNKVSHCFHCFPIYLPSSDGTRCHDLSFLNVDCVDHHNLWKILKETDIPDHLTCLLRSLFAGQETTFRTRHGIIDWFQIGKRVCQGCILSPCLFNLNAEYIMRNAGLVEAQAGNKIAGRNFNNFGYAGAPPLWQVVYMQIHHPYGRK